MLDTNSSKKYFKGNNNELYLSTHGHGVAWLHIRISIKPKYFRSIN